VEKYKVSFKPSALKELERLSPPLVDRIFLRIGNLQEDPRPAGCKKLKGGEAEWRIRIGDYRVVYTIDDRRMRIEITRVRHRRDVYD
jgi:mRNA interferase RelE/StbE